jgi:hypothetical protein
MKKERHPGADASQRMRSARSLAHLETMREAYVGIVRKRLADPTINAKRTLSHLCIARELTEAGFRAPLGGPITYKIAFRLCEIVGTVEPLPEPELVKKSVAELEVGDCILVISPHASARGWTAKIVRVLSENGAFAVVFPSLVDVRERIYLADQIEHQPDERQFYDPLSILEGHCGRSSPTK